MEAPDDGLLPTVTSICQVVCQVNAHIQCTMVFVQCMFLTCVSTSGTFTASETSGK